MKLFQELMDNLKKPLWIAEKMGSLFIKYVILKILDLVFEVDVL